MKRGQMLRFSDPAALDAHLHAKGGPVPAPLESEIQTQVLDVLAIHPEGGLALSHEHRQRPGSKASMSNMDSRAWRISPARLRDGRRLEIELKRAGEKPDDDQQSFSMRSTAPAVLLSWRAAVADVMHALEKA